MTDVAITGFDVQVVLPLSTNTSRRVRSEGEAAELAMEWVGANQTQITITAHTTDTVRTFGIRHITWKENVGVHDSGWRIWNDGDFLGGGPLPWPISEHAWPDEHDKETP